MRRLLASLALVALAIPASGAEVVVSNVPYAYANDRARVLLDWIVPDGFTGARPVLIWLHGGGWSAGDKATGSTLPTWLRAAYVIASVNYRLTAQAANNTTSPGIWKRQIQDVRAAIRFVRAQAGTNIAGTTATVDPNRIAIAGRSAGGHLAEYAALTWDDPTIDNPPTVLSGGAQNVSARVRAVVSDAAPQNLATQVSPIDAAVTALLGVSAAGNPALAAAASPITKVRADAPPMLLTHRTEDVTVLPEQSEDFVTAAEAVNADVALVLDDGDHDDDLTAAQETAVLAFLAANL